MAPCESFSLCAAPAGIKERISCRWRSARILPSALAAIVPKKRAWLVKKQGRAGRGSQPGGVFGFQLLLGHDAGRRGAVPSALPSGDLDLPRSLPKYGRSRCRSPCRPFRRSRFGPVMQDSAGPGLRPQVAASVGYPGRMRHGGGGAIGMMKAGTASTNQHVATSASFPARCMPPPANAASAAVRPVETAFIADESGKEPVGTAMQRRRSASSCWAGRRR